MRRKCLRMSDAAPSIEGHKKKKKKMIMMMMVMMMLTPTTIINPNCR